MCYSCSPRLTLPGKQARTAHNPAEPTTHVSPVNAHQQRAANGHAPESSQAQGNQPPDAGSSNQNQPIAAAANAVHSATNKVKPKVDSETLARIVAEEKEAKGKLPQYRGLERWQLLEKMGDGAFSNVYRARDLEGDAGEVAIKVVRKFEMNSSQVCCHSATSSLRSLFLALASLPVSL